MNQLRVVSTHQASSNELVEEETATSNTSMNQLRVISTHQASSNELVEEETTKIKYNVNIAMSQ
jgi:hypothetical protein